VAGGLGPPLEFKILAKKVVFLVLSGKKQISLFLASPWKNFGKSPSAPPPEKNFPTHMVTDTKNKVKCVEGFLKKERHNTPCECFKYWSASATLFHCMSITTRKGIFKTRLFTQKYAAV